MSTSKKSATKKSATKKSDSSLAAMVEKLDGLYDEARKAEKAGGPDAPKWAHIGTHLLKSMQIARG